MATVGEDQPPTSNGVNGHPSPSTNTSPANGEHDPSQKSPSLIAKPDSSLESSHLKNQDAFVANQSIADEPTEATKDPEPVSPAPSISTTEAQPIPSAEDTLMSDTADAPTQDATGVNAAEAKSTATSPAKENPTEQPASTSDAVKANDAAMDNTKGGDTEGTDATLEQPASADVEMTGAEEAVDAPATAPQPELQLSDPAGGDAPSMSNLAITETQGEPSIPATADTSMTDAPSQPAKVAREREEDDAEERSAKRARTEDAAEADAAAMSTNAVENEAEATHAVGVGAAKSSEDFIPPPREWEWQPGSLSDPESENLEVTPYVSREFRNQVLAIVKKTKAGMMFKDPVGKSWPAVWEQYCAKITEPMDIGQIERNLRENKYQKIGEVINHVFLLYENAVRFNGRIHDVTLQGKSLLDNIFGRMARIPAIQPPKPEKKETKAAPTRQTEPRAATQRRESRGNAPAPAAVPPPQPEVVVDTTPVAFPAGGTPIIRRDSTKVDSERPKRPVQPPKNRDLPYEVKNSKKKKAQPEIRFCEEVLREVTKSRHHEANHWFLYAVDPVAQGLPTYHKIIKKPMDLGTMSTKLSAGEYNSPKEFESDFNQIIKNCYKFNGEPSNASLVSLAAEKLHELFSQKWKEKDAWIAAHAPPPAPASASSPGAGAEEDSDDEAEASEAEAEIEAGPVSSATLSGLETRLAEENQRFHQLLGAKVPDSTLINTQQTMINLITTQIINEKKRLAEEETKTKKPSKPKPSKAKKAGGATTAPAKKAGGAGGAKKGGAAGGRKGTKARVMGQAEKDVVSESINELDGTALERAIDIIKKDTHQEEGESGELELDIDQLSQDALGKIYDLILRALPKVRTRVEKSKPAALPSPPPAEPPKSSKPKKHKPMGKFEQESRIEKLRDIKAAFQRNGSGSQEPLPSVEGGQPAREEDEDSEADSEEE